MSSRTYGLTLDRLVGATVVMADGSIKYSSQWDTPSFHWALRGAGSSFGIVAELDFMTFAAPEVLTSFSIDLDWSEEEAVEGILAFQEFGVHAPRELNMQMFMGPRGQAIQGLFHGSLESLDTALRPLLGDINGQVSKTKTMNWIESVEHFSGDQPLVQRRPYDRVRFDVILLRLGLTPWQHSTFYTTSLLTHALTRDQAESLANALFTNAKDPSARKSWYLLLDLFGGPNSAVSDRTPAGTAFPHRDKLLLYQFSDGGSGGEYPPEGFDLLRRFRESVTSGMADGEWGMYANYLDTQLDGDTAAGLYYGGNLERLRVLKGEFDPDDVFWNPQGIRPA